MTDKPTMGRYAEIPYERMTPAQQEAYRFLVDGPRGRLPGPYKVWVHNPKLVHAAAPMGQHFTPGSSTLTEREREIAVLVITSSWNSDYPTAAHEKRGKAEHEQRGADEPQHEDFERGGEEALAGGLDA